MTGQNIARVEMTEQGKVVHVKHVSLNAGAITEPRLYHKALMWTLQNLPQFGA